MHYLGTNITKGIIDKKTQRRMNKARAWKYGYNSEYDIVVISKDGTLGKVFNINGLNIGIPDLPEDETEIINHDLPKYAQKWKRQPLPKGLNAETEHQAQYAEYIEREFERREKGVFVYINGEPIYITGTQYFFLQWVKLDEGYPTFRVIQNDLMQYWEACKADYRSYGICYVKNRRFGWSSECIAEQLCAGTETENSLCGIMSKTGEDARNMFGRLIRSFKKLPSFFTPTWDGTSNPKKELNLTEPTKKRSTKDPVKKKEESDGLDTTIRYYSTALNSMDGERVFRSAIDESGKFPKEVPFDRYWSIVKTSHRVGSRIVGKSMVGSTMNARKDGGQAFKDVYDKSDPTKRNKNGQTPSGLYKLFIPAKYCIEGFFDEYGYSIVEDPETPVKNEFGDLKTIGSVTFLNNESEALKDDPEAYYEFMRQFPNEEEHAFRDTADECAFDIAKLYEQLDYNENELAPGTIQRGNFQWKGGVQDTEVEWVPSPKGRFYITWHPDEQYRNKWDWVTEHGIRARKPRAGHLGSLGCDPYNRSKTVDDRGSKGSIHGQTKSNTMGIPGNFFFLEYIDKPRTVELFFEDVIMCMVYYSMPVLIELSNEKFLTTLKNRGYRWFSMNRPDKKWRDLSATEKEFGGIPAQGKAIGDWQFYAVEAFVNDHVGVETRINESEGYRKYGEMGEKIYFNRTLTQWKDVDPEKRTKYDAYISSSLVLIANQIRVVQSNTKERKPIRLPISRYDNTGSISKRIA